MSSSSTLLTTTAISPIVVSSKTSSKARFKVPTKMTQIPADPSKINGIKIENCIGFAQIPLGLAGPLTIISSLDSSKNTTKQQPPISRTVLAPLATVEATLVASCARGCKVLQQCGGAHAAALSESMSRAPVFYFSTINDAVAFFRRTPALEEQFRLKAKSTSGHLRLLRLRAHIIGTTVHVKLDYACGDAAGQNMTTIATHAACRAYLASPAAAEARIVGYALDGQFSSDKKPSWETVLHGRGVQVMAWATLHDDVCRRVLGVSTAQMRRMIEVARDGAIRAGMFGSNINTVNIVAAMFIACGQDAASVAEAGFSHLTAELDPTTRDLTLSLYFPSMPVGTVGGGTGYATQKEALELIGCYGSGKKWALAETVASFALALEISTLSAMTNDTFSASHKRLARL